MTVVELMKLTFGRKLSELDQYRVIRDLTDIHDVMMLELLLKDIDQFMESKKGTLPYMYEYDEKVRTHLSNPLDFKTPDDIEKIELTLAQKKSLFEKLPGRIAYDLKPLSDLRSLVERLIGDATNKLTDRKQDNIIKVEESLKPFNGYWKDTKILKDDDFKYLIELTNYLVRTEELPQDIKAIKPETLSADFIKHTFYNLYTKLYSGNNKSLRDTWVLFIRTLFSQFEKYESRTIYKTFKKKPKSYDQDLEFITHENT